MAMETEIADSYATQAAAAMVDGDHNGNGQWQRRRQWATATAMATGLTLTTEMAMVIEMAMAMARVTITKGGFPLHVPAMCSAFGQATPCFRPYGHKESAFTSAASWG